jgi:beta-lactam-binding protein with PASTA domain
MRRFFRIVLAALAMMSVALLSALATMRLAIHGTEVEVPNLAGLTLAEASDRTLSKRLNLNLENSFYSTTVPAGRVLAQSPAPGTKVRKQWNVRVTQSLGPQRVAIPNVLGQQEREATLNIRHVGLNVGIVAHLPGQMTSTPGVVLAQSPPPNAAGVDRPRVSILLSQTDAPPPSGFVMPDVVRMNYAQAFLILTNAGLHVGATQDIVMGLPPAPAASPAAAAPATATPPATSSIAGGTVIAQSPPAGHRVTSADNIRLSVAR